MPGIVVQKEYVYGTKPNILEEKRSTWNEAEYFGTKKNKCME